MNSLGFPTYIFGIPPIQSNEPAQKARTVAQQSTVAKTLTTFEKFCGRISAFVGLKHQVLAGRVNSESRRASHEKDVKRVNEDLAISYISKFQKIKKGSTVLSSNVLELIKESDEFLAKRTNLKGENFDKLRGYVKFLKYKLEEGAQVHVRNLVGQVQVDPKTIKEAKAFRDKIEGIQISNLAILGTQIKNAENQKNEKVNEKRAKDLLKKSENLANKIKLNRDSFFQARNLQTDIHIFLNQYSEGQQAITGILVQLKKASERLEAKIEELPASNKISWIQDS